VTRSVTRRPVKLGGLAVVTALTIASAACGSSNNATSPSSGGEGGTFIDGGQLSQADNLTSFDPGLVQTIDESQITTALYDGLTDFDFTDKEKPVLKPLVAEKWTTNADASEFTFTVRKGQQFDNGDPVLPSSFKYAWERNGSKELASNYGYFIDYIKGGAALQKGDTTKLDSVVADDNAMTLKVTLESPQADFPAIVTHPFFAPLPEKLVSKLADQTQWDKGMMVGNGPFKMEKPKSDQEVVLVRNDKWAGNVYGDKKAKLDKIVFRISKDVQSAYNDFEAGGVMSSKIPPGRYAEAVGKHPNTTKSPTLSAYYFDFGFTDPMLSGPANLKLRQAISLIIDRDEINSKVYEGVRQIPTGIVMPGIPGFKRGLCKYCARNADEAKKLFGEWKAAGGNLSGPITLDYNTGAGHEDVVAIIQNNMKELGIETATNPVSEKYFSRMPKGECHFCRAGWIADYPAYSTFMLDLFSTTAVGGNNLGSFSDPKFDEILAKAQAEPDNEKRYGLYQQAESYLLNDVVATVPINWYVGDQVYTDKAVNYDEPPLKLMLWERVGLK
jgi:oligopeptide transport system substrate-binding protein